MDLKAPAPEDGATARGTMVSVPRPGGAVVAEKFGSTGPVIVLLSGLGDLRESYRHLLGALSAAHTVYNMDLRGHGDSDASFKSYSCQDIAGDVLALLEQENVTEATVAGNSMGAGAACFAAAEDPERVKGIVLLGPFVRDMPGDKYFRMIVPLLMARPWGAAVWMAFKKGLVVTPPPDHAAAAKRCRATLANHRRVAAIRAMMRASKAPVDARLGEVKARALVIMGDKDPDFKSPEAEAKLICDKLGGGGQVAMVAESGHYPQTEHPEQVANLLIDFLNAA